MGTLDTKGRSGRMYIHPDTGAELPSVTTFLSVLDKPALPRWAAKTVAQYAVDHVDAWSGLPYDDRVKLLKGIPWDRSLKAAQAGTDVHSYIENRILGLTEADPQNVESENAERVLQELSDMGANLVDSECTVVSDQWRYAGTFDAIYDIGNELIMVDWKSSKDVYPDMALQQAAYIYADYYVDRGGNKTWLLDDFGKPLVTKSFIGHVPKEGRGKGLVELKVGQAERDAMINARQLWQWVQDNK